MKLVCAGGDGWGWAQCVICQQLWEVISAKISIHVAIVELAVGLFFAFVVTIALCSYPVVICCCVPGCILFGTRKRTVYQNI